ncbi:FAD-binding oxidoreductase, partial [bacterium]|nr:FAD-binding oxidoreductase [bacterium]
MQDKILEAEKRLKPILGKRVSILEAHRMSYSRDWSPRMYGDDNIPEMVAVPRNTKECQEIVKVAYDLGIPVVAFAGGTGMGGGVQAWKGGIVVDTKGMDQVIEFDEKNMSVRVGAGITIWHLNEFLAKHGMWLPHQPESKQASTVGAAIGC